MLVNVMRDWFAKRIPTILATLGGVKVRENKLGLSWAKLKFCVVRVFDEVQFDIMVGVHY